MASVASLEASVSGSCFTRGAHQTQSSDRQQCRAVCNLPSYHIKTNRQIVLPVFSGLGHSLRLNGKTRNNCGGKARVAAPLRVTRMALGEDPEFFDDDYLVVGLAHCFLKDEDSKLSDQFVIEAIPAGAVECMNNGGVTCYKHSYGTTLGEILKQDVSILPEEFHGGVFADDFDFRAKCAARTWKRSHAQEIIMQMVPRGTVRSDFNFKIEDKRILNQENEVKDEDNIKQDMSIDVYGRKDEEKDDEIAKLYAA